MNEETETKQEGGLSMKNLIKNELAAERLQGDEE